MRKGVDDLSRNKKELELNQHNNGTHTHTKVSLISSKKCLHSPPLFQYVLKRRYRWKIQFCFTNFAAVSGPMSRPIKPSGIPSLSSAAPTVASAANCKGNNLFTTAHASRFKAIKLFKSLSSLQQNALRACKPISTQRFTQRSAETPCLQ